MSPLKIRPAEVQDAPLLAAAEREITKTPGQLVSRPEELRDEAFVAKIAALNGRPDGRYLVAEAGGRIVGHAYFEPLHLESIRHVVHLAMAVHVGHQGQGVGRALLEALLAWARQTPGIEKAELHVRSGNERAQALYRSLGFVEEGRLKRRVRLAAGTYQDDVLMALWLKPKLAMPGPAMDLPLDEDFYLSDIRDGDQDAYVEHLQVRQIYEQTLAIPFPYKRSDADWWIGHIREETLRQGRSVNWAIRRRSDGLLLGGIGYHGFELGKSHQAEIGYWLAQPYWGRGVMTKAARAATRIGLEEFGLMRVTAHVFDFNAGSARVLEKAGYQFEGHLRQQYKKDGKVFDGKLYAITAQPA